ncbi:hypothetical protein BpHYR1_012631 [Brachionus plicatilis]|uniref:Uncharacterized protein n=1 Tax=Brachionus plicatilis TaxID=10195 RepID=A0A3M7SUX9_BRAPC|nr:hypothetical protein BpHYR1_012631 [Brachionus plicatilis]
MIRSLFDYCFVILNSGTQRIHGYFPIETSIKINERLKLDLVDDRENKINRNSIAKEIVEFLIDAQNEEKSSVCYSVPTYLTFSNKKRRDSEKRAQTICNLDVT